MRGSILLGAKAPCLGATLEPPFFMQGCFMTWNEIVRNKVEAPIQKCDLFLHTMKSIQSGEHGYPKMGCMDLIHCILEIYLNKCY